MWMYQASVVIVLIFNLHCVSSQLQVRWAQAAITEDGGNRRTGQVEGFAPTHNTWWKTCSSNVTIRSSPSRLGRLLCQKFGFDNVVSIRFASGAPSPGYASVDIVSCPDDVDDISMCQFAEIRQQTQCGRNFLISLTCNELTPEPLPAPPLVGNNDIREITCNATRRMRLPTGPQIRSIFHRSRVGPTNQCSMEFLVQGDVYLHLDSSRLVRYPNTPANIACNSINHVIIRQILQYQRIEPTGMVDVREVREERFCGQQNDMRTVIISPVAVSVNITFVRATPLAGAEQFDITLEAIPQIAAHCGSSSMNVSIVKQKLAGWNNGTWTAQVVNQSLTIPPSSADQQCRAVQSDVQSRSTDFFQFVFDATRCPRIFNMDTDNYTLSYQVLVARSEQVDIGAVQIEYRDQFLIPIRCYLKMDPAGAELEDVNSGDVLPFEDISETIVIPYSVNVYRDSSLQVPFQYLTFNNGETAFYLVATPMDTGTPVNSIRTEVERCLARKSDGSNENNDIVLYNSGTTIPGVDPRVTTNKGLQSLTLAVTLRTLSFSSGSYDFMCYVRSGFGNEPVAYHSNALI
ncbi:uncharacterized protein LOC129600752 [Paramacrobiotus metropolitanus]|uniref:uncharacterized protein LOC129600752 n=1 Tax=Paramacrobiotus metropolitanus TaxID=2943436 RepID=UPI0024459255|nr:uncharacterized protein LOC129600752 [Paramacrobiotus metropolitanus]